MTVRILPDARVQKKLQNLFSGTLPAENERFLLEYLQAVAQFRLAMIAGKGDLVSLTKTIEEKEKTLTDLDISGEDIQALNFFVRDNYKSEVALETLISSIKKQLGENN